MRTAKVAACRKAGYLNIISFEPPGSPHSSYVVAHKAAHQPPGNKTARVGLDFHSLLDREIKAGLSTPSMSKAQYRKAGELEQKIWIIADRVLELADGYRERLYQKLTSSAAPDFDN